MGHFIPVFTNSRLEIKEFGSSDRVVIFEPLVELIDEQIDFLRCTGIMGKNYLSSPRYDALYL